MRHTNLVDGGGMPFRDGGEPFQLGDEVVIGDDVYVLSQAPREENIEGHLVKSWAVHVEGRGWFAIGEIFPPEERRDH